MVQLALNTSEMPIFIFWSCMSLIYKNFWAHLVFSTGNRAAKHGLSDLDKFVIYVCCLITNHGVKQPAHMLSNFCIPAYQPR